MLNKYWNPYSFSISIGNYTNRILIKNTLFIIRFINEVFLKIYWANIGNQGKTLQHRNNWIIKKIMHQCFYFNYSDCTDSDIHKLFWPRHKIQKPWNNCQSIIWNSDCNWNWLSCFDQAWHGFGYKFLQKWWCLLIQN